MPVYFFTETTGLPDQQPGDAFGPANTNSFNISSKFKIDAPAKAFAVTNGQLVVQNVPGNPDTVNIILKPQDPLGVSFTPVKYYVYRGLVKNDFLDGTNIKSPASDNSELIEKIWNNHNNWKTKTGNTSAPDPSPKIFGYDTAIPDTVRIDELFANLQEPKPVNVSAGMWLGNFPNGAPAGLEIILEEGVFEYEAGNAYGSPKLNYLRSQNFQIDVSGISDPFDKKVEKEKILNFIDPAAFYGLFSDKGIVLKNTSGSGGFSETLVKGQHLADQVVGKFATKDRVYIDIRNDYGYSYDFHENYAGQFAIGVGASSPLPPATYGILGWPLHSLVLSSSDVEVHVGLNTNSNPRPVIFDKNKNTILGEATLFNTFFTNPTSFLVPNFGGVCSTCWKLHYYKLPDVVNAGPEGYLTNALGPIDTARTADPDVTSYDFIFNTDVRLMSGIVPGTSTEFAFISESGATFDDSGNIPGGSPNDKFLFYSRNILTHLSTGKSLDKLGSVNSLGLGIDNGFFNQSFLKNVKIDLKTIADNSTDVSLMLFDDNFTNNRMVENLLGFGITKEELSNLKSVTGLRNNHHRFLKLSNETILPGNDGFRYEVKVIGLNAANTFEEKSPGSPVFVYSKDGTAFSSKSFSANILTQVTYMRNCEELVGENILSGTQTVEDYFIAQDILPALPGAPKTISELVSEFITTIQAIPENSSAKAALINTTIEYGGKIWQRGEAIIKYNNFENPDDRPLYWARLKMGVVLKNHPFLFKSTSDRKELFKLLNKKSRNYDGINFSYAIANNLKKVLITGFDPFFLLANPLQHNPSGAVVMALNSSGSNHIPNAYVQCALFPVRYFDFDDKIVEDVITPFLNLVDIIITISLDISETFCNIDRFCTKTRGGFEDNLTVGKGLPGFKKKLPFGLTWKNHFETTLPFVKTIFNQNGDTPFVRYNQTYVINGVTKGGFIKKNQINSANDNESIYEAPPFFTDPLNNNDEIKEGSGGDYLSNELFYRVSRLRIQNNPSLPTGHLHIPLHDISPSSGTSGNYVIDIIKKVENFIINAIS